MSWKSRQAEIESRRPRVSQLLLAGKTYREIAEFLGVGLGTIHRDVKAIRESWREEQRISTDAWVTQELARLAKLEGPAVSQALEGSLRAVDRCLRIMERRARLLGLDAPKQHEHEIQVPEDGGPLVKIYIPDNGRNQAKEGDT